MGILAHAFGPTTKKTEAGRILCVGQPGLDSELQTLLKLQSENLFVQIKYDGLKCDKLVPNVSLAWVSPWHRTWQWESKKRQGKLTNEVR